jgi:branched-chain amino acid transport system ATP-binding protein
MNEGEVLEARGVTVHFGGLPALDDVSLNLAPGEILGLIGPNGSGKTTLVNVLSGYIRSFEGDVRLGRRRLGGRKPHAVAKAGVVRTFQGGRLFRHLTVEENIEAGAAARTGSRRASREEAAGLIERFGLLDYAPVRASAVPYGVERLVVIARALASRPRFLLLDEPAAGLDELEGAALAAALRETVRDFECALLLIEHDMAFVGELSHRLHVLAEGKTLLEGKPDDVLASSLVADVYLGVDEDG